jgi:hypothetical protein
MEPKRCMLRLMKVNGDYQKKGRCSTRNETVEYIKQDVGLQSGTTG